MTISRNVGYGEESNKFFQNLLGKGGFVPYRPKQTEDLKSTSVEGDPLKNQATPDSPSDQKEK